MRLITRLTDVLVNQLAPKASGKAACDPSGWYVCLHGEQRYCETHQNCTTYCRNTGNC